MKKSKYLILSGLAIVIAITGAAIAGGPDFGRGQWYQHPAVFPAAQTLGAGATIAADACGGIKRITATAARTTDTTNTFTAPSALNAGCLMNVTNVSAFTITLDSNALFPVPGGVDMVLQSSGSATVWSDGSLWRRQAQWTAY